jgi:hypothetical protein
MWKPQKSKRRLGGAMALAIVAALVPAGCSYDAGQLLVNKGIDSGAIGGASLDGNGSGDSPSMAAGGIDGASLKGTGGTMAVVPTRPYREQAAARPVVVLSARAVS